MKLARLSNGWMPASPSIFDRLFEGDLMDWNNLNYSNTNSTLPAVNVKENENEYSIEVAAPGLKREDFQIQYDSGRLTISSEISDSSEVENENYSRKEFSYQSFQRSFTVAETEVDADKIVAHYENGILHIALPKREEVKPKPAKQILIS